MRSLRLLFIEPCPRDFGGYFRAISLARAIAKLGHQVKVVVPARTWGPLRTHSEVGEGVHLVEHAEISRWPFGKIVRIPLVAAEVLASKADLVHVFCSVHPENLVGLLLACALKKKVLVDWDDFWQDSPAFLDAGSAVRSYVKFAEEFGIQRGLGVTVASAYLANRAKRLRSGPIHRVPNGVWKEQFDLVPRSRARQELEISPDALVVLAFGNTYLQGRGRMLVEAFARLLREKPDAIALSNLPLDALWRADGGSGPLPPSAARARCIGQIPQERLGLYLGAADFVVFLSSNCPAERASYPIRIGTYLNGECPIVTNQQETEVGLLVRRFGCGIIAKDPVQAAYAMIKAHQDVPAYQAMADGTRAAKAALDCDLIGQDLLRFYEKILRGSFCIPP